MLAGILDHRSASELSRKAMFRTSWFFPTSISERCGRMRRTFGFPRQITSRWRHQTQSGRRAVRSASDRQIRRHRSLPLGAYPVDDVAIRPAHDRARRDEAGKNLFSVQGRLQTKKCRIGRTIDAVRPCRLPHRRNSAQDAESPLLRCALLRRMVILTGTASKKQRPCSRRPQLTGSAVTRDFQRRRTSL
jgi:hypothetical protein